jgi:hypothetical protein
MDFSLNDVEKEKEKEEKEIKITGTANRYQINKLVVREKTVKKRKDIEKKELPNFLFSLENQIIMLKEIYTKDFSLFFEYKDLIKQQIERKLQGYSSQDLIKKKLDKTKFIKLEEIIEKLYESKLQCYYCQRNMLLLYDIVREIDQWTLDRIDNDYGHNNDNLVISCLNCNLKRRKTGKDAFLFTKQLTIVKKESNED